METYIPLEKLERHRRKENIKKVFRIAKEMAVRGIKTGTRATIKGTRATVRKIKESAPHVAKNIETGRAAIEKFGRTMEKFSPPPRKGKHDPFNNVGRIWK